MALGAAGCQSGCLPKQALCFIITTVSYEAPLCAPHTSHSAHEAAGPGWAGGGQVGVGTEAQCPAVGPTQLPAPAWVRSSPGHTWVAEMASSLVPLPPSLLACLLASFIHSKYIY